MSLVALQPDRFVERLTLDVLLSDEKFATAKADCEAQYEDWYWDGSVRDARTEEIKKIRRRLEDRLRKDSVALLAAFKAVFK